MLTVWARKSVSDITTYFNTSAIHYHVRQLNIVVHREDGIEVTELETKSTFSQLESHIDLFSKNFMTLNLKICGKSHCNDSKRQEIRQITYHRNHCYITQNSHNSSQQSLPISLAGVRHFCRLFASFHRLTDDMYYVPKLLKVLILSIPLLQNSLVHTSMFCTQTKDKHELL